MSTRIASISCKNVQNIHLSRPVFLRHLATSEGPRKFAPSRREGLNASRKTHPSQKNRAPQKNSASHIGNPPQQSWLTRQVNSSPAAKKVFMKVVDILGYGTPKQVAGRRTIALYHMLCATRAEEERNFWLNGCNLPPTFQSWFVITNLHVWMLTVRLRALPKPHGIHHIQGLIDHFFMDVEDRIRWVLQPGAVGLNMPNNMSFYDRPEASQDTDGKPRRRGRAPERLITRQLKIFREQWAGMGMSCDLGLITTDMELAAAIWRNLLGARGARGIAFEESATTFRRTVNLVGGEVDKVKDVEKRGLDVEEARDDYSGVHDFAPSEVNKYIQYPELMATLVEYVRREITRLDKLSDEEITSGSVSSLRFGPIKKYSLQVS